MPTGSGKSLCFQLPALARGGLTLVVSPLIALMRDQVAQLARTRHFRRGAQFRLRARPSAAASLARLRDRSLRLLYVAPERLLRDDTLEMLQRRAIDLLAIDEAHCVSQWGHDFRPEYLRLREARAGARRSADHRGDGDRRRADARRHRRAAVRAPRRACSCARSTGPTSFSRCGPRPTRRASSTERLDAHRGESGIVYCASRRRTEELAREFSERGRRALPYHAGLDHVVRSHNQDAFLQEDGVVMCATIAFGMGDRQARRALRLPRRHAVVDRGLLSGDRPRRPRRTARRHVHALRRRRHRAAPPPDRRGRRARRAQADRDRQARRSGRAVRDARAAAGRCCSASFGEESRALRPLRRLPGRGAARSTARIEAQKALSAVLRTSGRFFFGHLANILVGQDERGDRRATATTSSRPSASARIARPPNGAACSGNCCRRRLIEHDRADRDRLIVTEEGRKVLRGEAPFALREDVVAKKPRRDKRAAPRRRRATPTPICSRR